MQPKLRASANPQTKLTKVMITLWVNSLRVVSVRYPVTLGNTNPFRRAEYATKFIQQASTNVF